MSHFHIVRGRLYRARRKQGPPEAVFEGERLIIRYDEPAEFIARTVDANVYAHCQACEPVYYVSDRAAIGWDTLDERRPWSEWTARFNEGRLVEVLPFRLESRDDVRTELRERGLKILEDDDRLVLRHRARAEQRGVRGRGSFGL